MPGRTTNPRTPTTTPTTAPTAVSNRRTARSLGRAAGATLGLAGAVVAIQPVSPVGAAPALPSFPGAEGFGAGTTGGRGGDVVIVDTLEPFGPGSLGDALSPDDCRPRTVVFSVSGVIEVPYPHDIELRCGDVTIAGQTAPGAGITIHGRIDGYEAGGNIIMRHLRFRPPPITDAQGGEKDLGSRYDALQLSGNPGLMLDHLSLAWGSDETLDIYEGSPDATVQWTTIEQSNPEGQPEGPHNDAMIAGPDSPRVTVHHVLMAHHRARCPALSAGPAELLNSVTYDCQDAFVHHNPAEGEFHIAGNTFIQGPNHDNFTPLYFDDEDPGGTTYWLHDNQITAPGQFEGVVDDIADTPLGEPAFAGADPDQVISTPTDFATLAPSSVPVSMQSPADAYDAVLAQAGAFPRDQITAATIDDVRTGGGSWDPDPPADLIAGLTPGAAPADADRDGMADEWERANGLDPGDGDDHASVRPSGYTAIEEYVNGLSDALTGAAPAATGRPDGGGSGSDGGSGSGGSGGSADDRGTTGSTARPGTTARPSSGGAGPASSAAGGTPSGATDPVSSSDAVVLARVGVGLGGAALAVAAAALVLTLRRRPTP